MTSPPTTTALLWLCAGFLGSGFAGTTPADTKDTGSATTGVLVGECANGSDWDRVLSVPTLYKNAKNPWVHEVAVCGQLQTQYAYGSDASGQFGSNDMPDELTWGDIEVRRMRLGLKGRLIGNLTFLYLIDLHPDLSPRIYKRTPETYFTWSEGNAFSISAGKSELKFNREQEYSSKELLPFERTALGNMFYGGELLGTWVCGKGIAGGWLYHLGAYNNERVDEISHFNGGSMILGKIGYDYTQRTGFDLAEVKFQYLHNTDPGFADSVTNLASPSYSDCVSISNQITAGPFGLTTEFLWGDGVNGRSDVCGLMAMPTYFFTEKLQLITTFEFAGSREDNGVILPTRYEALSAHVGDKAGDAYFAGFAGLNYYIHSHNLKLMSGVKYSYLDGGSHGGDFDGWTMLAGVRIAF